MTLTLQGLEKLIDQILDEQKTEGDVSNLLGLLERAKEKTTIKLISKTKDEETLYGMATPTRTSSTKIIAEEKLEKLYPARYKLMKRERDLQAKTRRYR